MARGSRPGERRGGRKKGTPNKRTVALNMAIKATGMSPLEFALSIMQAKIPDGATPAEKMGMLAVQLDACKTAIPYCHARMGSTDQNPNDKSDRAALLREAARKARELSNPKEKR